MKHIKIYEGFREITTEDIKPNVIYEYSDMGYIAIGKLKINEKKFIDYTDKEDIFIFYDIIDNEENYRKEPWNTNYKAKPNFEAAISESDLQYFTVATPEEIETHNILTISNKYNI